MTSTTLGRTQWRLLNHLQTAHERGLIRRNVRVLLATEDGVWSDLIEVQDRGLVEFWFGDKPIRSDNLATLFRAEMVDVSLTSTGVRTITGDPRNRVIRALAEYTGAGRPIREVKKIADCDDDLLKEMNGLGLIEPYPDAANIRLDQFRRLPEHLVIRLAPRGREYAPN